MLFLWTVEIGDYDDSEVPSLASAVSFSSADGVASITGSFGASGASWSASDFSAGAASDWVFSSGASVVAGDSSSEVDVASV